MPLPRNLFRTIGNGQPQFKSAVLNPAPLMRSKQHLSAAGSLPINCGVIFKALSLGDTPRSSRSFKGSTPALAVIKGVTASVKPYSSSASAKLSRKHLIVTPLNGARIIFRALKGNYILPITALMRLTPADELCSFLILKEPSSFVLAT